MTLEEYKKWLEEIKAGTRDDDLDFVWAIMKSSFVEYHFELIKDESLDEVFRRDLSARFKEHHQAGFDFLIQKLEQNEGPSFHGEVIFMLGRMKPIDDTLVLDWAKKLSKSADDAVRENAIIVLGWKGGLEELGLLRDHLLHDEYDKCRAWAASSMMQMWFSMSSEKLRDFARQSFAHALENEKDDFVLSCIIATMKEIEGKKFGITQKALDNLDPEAIAKAVKSVKRFIKKNR